MNESELYKKLIDLYAERSLPPELESEMEVASQNDPNLKAEMEDLRWTVDTLKSMPAPEFTEESYQRILMKVYASGVEMLKRSPDPSHLQLKLPLQG